MANTELELDGSDTLFPVAKVTTRNWALNGIFIIMLFGAIAAAQSFLMPVLLAILLFFVFAPFRRWMSRRGYSGSVTGAVVTLGMLVLIGVLTATAWGPVKQAASNSVEITQKLEAKMKELNATIMPVRKAAEKIDEVTNGAAEPEAAPTMKVETVNAKPSLLGKLAAAVPNALSQVVFTLVLLFFMIAAGDLLYLKIVQSFDTLKDKRKAYAALREIESSLGSYLSSITIVNVGLGIATGLAMWAWGMPAPVLFGVMGFAFNYIPFIGAIGGAAIATAVALITMDGFFYPALVGATFWGLTAIEGQFVTPYFVSRRLQLNEVVVFISVALWAWLWNVMGMIVAVPVLVVIRVLSSHLPGMEKFGNFLGGEPVPEPSDEEDEAATPAS